MWYYVNVYRMPNGSLYYGAITTMQHTIKLRAAAVQQKYNHTLFTTLKIKPRAGYDVRGGQLVKV